MIILTMTAIFICGKIIYKYGNTDVFLFLSKPVAIAISAFYGSDCYYTKENGFVLDEMSMTIDKSCSGFNFFIICNICLLLTILIQPIKSKLKFKEMISIPIMAYCCTIITNTFRIINLIEFQDKLSSFSGLSEESSHSMIGSFIYLTSLLTIHFIFIKIFMNRRSISNNSNYLTTK